jgi:AraC-like DNA-binding protein
LVQRLPASPLLQVLAARPSGRKRSHRTNHNHFWMFSLRSNIGPVHVQPLARLLPPLVLVKANHAQTLTLHTSLGLLASEMGEPAPDSEIVVNRLADVLFVQMLRAHIASREHPCNKGWLRAVFDPQIGLALKSMHDNVAAPWTVESLAAACGMSRSAFAHKFKDLVGEAPP